jgi:hypothetical protein
MRPEMSNASGMGCVHLHALNLASRCRFVPAPFDPMADALNVRVYDIPNRSTAMKFICLGYYTEQDWANVSQEQQTALMDECFAYDDQLRKGGHFKGGEALQSATAAKTLRYQGGKVVVTDGPFAETKEQIGGLLILEARDMAHAVELISKHPGVKFGPFEIRPADEMINAIFEERAAKKSKL